MTELPHVDSFDPEDKDVLASPSKSENSTTDGAAHEEERPTEPVELNIGDPHFLRRPAGEGACLPRPLRRRRGGGGRRRRRAAARGLR